MSAAWLPRAGETTKYLAAGLVYWASQKLDTESEQLPEPLNGELERIVIEDPNDLRLNLPVLLAASALIDAEQLYYPAVRARLAVEDELWKVRFTAFGKKRELRRLWADRYSTSSRAWDSLCQARANWDVAAVFARPARQLMGDKLFRREMEELARNLVLIAGVEGWPGQRHVLEFSYEASFTVQNPGGRLARLNRYVGWSPWQLDVLIGGRGGSQDLKVVTPAGAEIVQIVAEPFFQT
jgi:hypothetical protein